MKKHKPNPVHIFVGALAYVGLGISSLVLMSSIAVGGAAIISSAQTLLANKNSVAQAPAHTQVADASASQASPQPFDLQTDLEGLAYYTTQVPFKDLMAQHINWTANGYPYGQTCAVPPPADADGYPLTLKDTTCAFSIWLMLHIPVTPGAVKWPAGHYVLTYDGKGSILATYASVGKNQKNIAPGRIEFDVDAPGDLFALTIIDTDPADHLRNVHVFLASDEATYKTQPFRQEFLNELAPYKILRFMDWAGVSAGNSLGNFTVVSQPDPKTMVLGSSASSVDNFYNGMTINHVFVTSYEGATRTLHLANNVQTASSVYINDFANRTWDKRTPTDITKQLGIGGIAYEYMVQLCNTLNKDMWLNVPTAADDDFVRQLAQFLKTNLNSNLKIYIEYSNETWNFGYPGYDYSWSMTQKMNLPGAGVWVGGDQWQSYRATQIFQIFNSVFGQQDLRVNRTGSDRLVRILATQTGWVDRARGQLDWVMPANAAPTFGHKASEYADAWAVTDYWGFPSTVTGDESANLATYTNDQLIDLQKQSIGEMVAPTGPNNWLYQLAQLAKARGVKLIQYEGGVGFTVPNGNADTVTKITNLMRDPRMESVQAEALNQWIKLSQAFPGTIGNFAVFSDIGAYSKYGFWGALESVFQDPSSVPRYRALLKYMNGTLNDALSVGSNTTSNTTTSSNTSGNSTNTNTSTSNTTNNSQSSSSSSNSSSSSSDTSSSSGVASPRVESLPPKLVLTEIKVAVDLNPLLSCETLFLAASKIAACHAYIDTRLNYNWSTIDSFGDTKPATTSTIGTVAPVTPTPGSTAPSTSNRVEYLTTTLGVGATNNKVELLQRFLIAAGFLQMPANTTFGYYGSGTQSAVAKFQVAQGLLSAGAGSGNGLGTVGPKTLQAVNTYLNAHPDVAAKMWTILTPTITAATQANVSSFPAPSSASGTTKPSAPTATTKPSCVTPPPSTGSGVITQTLSVGMCSLQVITLQEILNAYGYTVASSGDGSRGHETIYYTSATAQAVAKFQKDFNLTSDGSGVLGAQTRAKLLEFFSSGTRPKK